MADIANGTGPIKSVAVLGSGVMGAGIDHMHQQIGVDDNIERRLECLHQTVRQLAHEANSVGQEDLLTAGQ